MIRAAGALACLVLLAAAAGAANADEGVLTGMMIGPETAQRIALPAHSAFDRLQADLDYPDNGPAVGYAVDFNADGAVDYLVRGPVALCGTGGCPWILVDGKSVRRVGEFFGSALGILDRRVNGWPVVQEFGKYQGDATRFATYVYDGSSYERVAELIVDQESLRPLYARLRRPPAAPATAR